MAYVVFNVDTTRLVRRANGMETFKTAAAANAHITRYLDGTKYAVAEAGDYFANIERQVERVNLMTGQRYMESVNTPSYCSPASESYWQI